MLVKLLDKFDPKSDGADRSYADIYDESAKLLYEEIDYTLEGKNGARFAASLKGIGLDYIKVPDVFWEATNERVLTMEYVESFKLTDMAKVEEAGLDKALLADRVADSFLTQILKTGYFHCDPHPGNLCVNKASAIRVPPSGVRVTSECHPSATRLTSEYPSQPSLGCRRASSSSTIAA